MTGSPTIWMNVTTSANWNRPAVGVVRVEQLLRNELMKLYGGNRFKEIVWNGKYFVELAKIVSPRNFTSFSTPIPKSSTFDIFDRFLFSQSEKRYLPSDIRDDFTFEHHEFPAPISFGDTVLSAGLDWNYRLAPIFKKMKNDGVSIVSFCYDLIACLFPQYCAGDVKKIYTEYFCDLSWCSSMVLCISNKTKEDYDQFLENLGGPETPTTVIPLGDILPSRDGTISDSIFEITSEKFILFVSTIERRKNHEILYRAYHLLCQQGLRQKLPKLVFVGMPGWGVNDFLKDVELDPLTQGLIVQLNNVSDAELGTLYDKAFFCAYPSFYEGWGLPVSEALAAGKVVLASDQGSLPEVGGDLVQYVDPWNADAWADALLDLIQNPSKVSELEARVRSGYKIRTWADTAKAVQNSIEELNARPAFPIRLLPGYDMSTHCGVHVGPSIMSTGKSGLLLFGPHRALPSGSFRILGFLHTQGQGKGSLKFKVTSNLGATCHAKKTLTWDDERLPSFPKREEAISIDFMLDEHIHNFELTCSVQGEIHVTLEMFEIDIVQTNVSGIPEASTDTIAPAVFLATQGD